MTRSPILISGCAAPHVPTRKKVCTPSSLSSSIPIATDGPPMPEEMVETGTPSKLPVKVRDRKSTRLNSSHSQISYADFCLKKKKKTLRLSAPLQTAYDAKYARASRRRSPDPREGDRPPRPARRLRTLAFFFFFNDTATTEIYTLSLHDALPISPGRRPRNAARPRGRASRQRAT